MKVKICYEGDYYEDREELLRISSAPSNEIKLRNCISDILTIQRDCNRYGILKGFIDEEMTDEQEKVIDAIFSIIYKILANNEVDSSDL